MRRERRREKQRRDAEPKQKGERTDGLKGPCRPRCHHSSPYGESRAKVPQGGGSLVSAVGIWSVTFAEVDERIGLLTPIEKVMLHWLNLEPRPTMLPSSGEWAVASLPRQRSYL